MRELAYIWPLNLLPNRYLRGEEVTAFGFGYQQRIILRKLHVDHKICFLPVSISDTDVKKMITGNRSNKVWVWSTTDDALMGYDWWVKNEFSRFEEGFVRSVGVSNKNILSYSFIKDRKGIYFDGKVACDLEDLIQNQQLNEELLLQTRLMMGEFIKKSISKYNAKDNRRVDFPENGVLVLGQVEGDRAIKTNHDGLQTNEQLVLKAIEKYGKNRVFYRPHPEVEANIRSEYSSPYKHLISRNILSAEIPISQLFKSTKYVYTICSLGGFEAMLHGAKVFTFGAPFYAGWGLSVDHLEFPRRKRKVTLEQLFYCAYMKYPMYFDPRTGVKLNLEDVINRMGKDGDRGSLKNRDRRFFNCF